MIDAAYIHWICSAPIGLFIAAIGIIGNVISCYIWKRLVRSKLCTNQSTGIYLIALGMIDSGFLIFFILTDSIRHIIPDINKHYAYAFFYSYFGFPMFFMFLVASIWLVVGIALNRLIMIHKPAKVRVWYTNKRTIYGIIATIVFSIIINIPHFFNYHPDVKNGTISIALTNYGKSEGSVNYEFWVHCIFVVLAPWGSIVLLNGMIIYKLKEQMRKFIDEDKKALNNSKNKFERREQQMTRMLLVLTFSFLLLLAWQCITQCFWMLGYGKDNTDVNSEKWNLVDTSFAFAKLGVVINSSINWVFYCMTSSMFRKEIRKFFRLMSSTYHVLSVNSTTSTSVSYSEKQEKSTTV